MMKDRRSHRYTILLAAVLLFSTGSLLGGELMEPQALSPAEERAVHLALEYLSEGQNAWLDDLASTSAFAEIEPAAAAQEIAVRAGAPDNARWRLLASDRPNSALFSISFPSGVEEHLELLMVEEGGWRISSLRILAEPKAWSTKFAAVVAPSGDRLMLRSEVWPLLALLELLALAGFARFLLSLQGSYRKVGVALASCVFLTCGAPAPTDVAPVDDSKPHFQRLGHLFDFRQLLQVADSETLTAARDALSVDAPLDAVADLWLAQRYLVDSRLHAAAAKIETLHLDVPAVSLAKARLASLRQDSVGVAMAWERFFELAPDGDQFLDEAHDDLVEAGYPERANDVAGRLAEIGSRTAKFYYDASNRAVAEDLISKAYDTFRTGWELAPRRRADILANPYSAYLLQQEPRLRQFVELEAASDPVVPCTARTKLRFDAFDGLRVQSSGGFVRVKTANSELELPGVCVEGAQAIDAESWLRSEQTLALEILAEDGTGASAAGPRWQEYVATAVAGLARDGQWPRIAELTKGVTASARPDLVQVRAQALHSTGRELEATNLLIELVNKNASSRRADPQTLFQLAELLKDQRKYDLAFRLMSRALKELPFEVSDRSLLEIKVEKRLAESSLMEETEHFSIHYPLARSLEYVLQLGGILESELQRVRRWIPVADDFHTDVYILDVEDFKLAYSRNLEVVGLFDTAIRLPLGDIGWFSPFIVSLISHELAHAMIASATDDRAPHWFHEGLAQHVEMRTHNLNPMPSYGKQANRVSFSLLESVLTGFSAPAFKTMAYDQTNWTLHYIESRFGQSGIDNLLRAFRDGLPTDLAVASALDLSASELDQQFWEWGQTAAPGSWKVELIEYDTEPPPLPVEEEEEDDC